MTDLQLTPAYLLHDHPLLTAWQDPESGVESFVLNHCAGTYQKAWYFVRPSVAGDSPYLWFYATDPPSRKWHTAVVNLNPKTPTLNDLTGTVQYLQSGNGVLSEDGRSAYIPVDDGIYHYQPDGQYRQLFRMPKSITENRYLFRLVTDLTIDSQGEHFLLDSWIGNQWLISLVDIKTGEINPLRWFGRDHHHAIFSYHDPSLFLISHGHWLDPYTGRKSEMDIRIWLMNTQLDRYEPLNPKLWFGRNSQTCHEWWTTNGMVQYCNYQRGIVEHDPNTGDEQLIWPHQCIHGMCDPTGRFLVLDEGCYQWNDKTPCRVWFFDRQQNKQIPIVSHMPYHHIDRGDVRAYHIDPHPHFSADGKYIIYTSTAVFGKPTVALCPVENVLAQLDKCGRHVESEY